ncbi:hypothetical protein [Ferrimonas marina]|uniref:Uncharacterized protein n=1 Tax=Ferrimonas marina TaxID=299255 RepID=A0A1M5VM32_9GAMM|nr:hypothetical protein [Ferrimonas marina]SHH75973.1 hypothetical protein SAMN02745129_2838 [Ferrimonas marina]
MHRLKDISNKDIPLPLYGSEIIDDVFCRFCISDFSAPLVVTFSHMGHKAQKADGLDSYKPWAFDFVKSCGFNSISFSCLGATNWYRSAKLEDELKLLSPLLDRFEVKLGYGGSMGGFGIGAFAKVLKLDRVLLINPISTLNADIAPWETRFSKWRNELDWSHGSFDGTDFESTGYVVYDPLYDLDRKHAFRYKNLTHLKVPGVGHSMPLHLKEMGALKKLFIDFANNQLDLHWFYKKVRNRKLYPRYYKWMLEHCKRTTPSRRKVISRHYNALNGYLGKSSSETDKLFGALRKAAIKLESTDLTLALDLMMQAKKIRTKSPFIDKKIIEYKRKLGQT